MRVDLLWQNRFGAKWSAATDRALPICPVGKRLRIAWGPALVSALLAAGMGSSRTPAAVPAARQLPELRDQIQQSLASTASPSAQWAIQVTAGRSGTTWFATNATLPLIPASCTKLYTAALALDRLGADYRWTTELQTSGSLSPQGELKGPLRVIGSGDPTFCARLHGGSFEEAFRPLVERVRASGIRKISGNLVCDESRFRGAPYGSGWEWDDLAEYYGAAVSALTAEDNSVQIIAEPGAQEGVLAKLHLAPIGGPLRLRSEVRTGPTNATPDLRLFRLPGEQELTVSGVVPLGGPPERAEASVPRPAWWFGELFREALRRSGIELTGQIEVVTAASALPENGDLVWRDLARIPSPPAEDVVREMMKPSQNLYAQLLLLSVGAETERYPQPDEPTDHEPVTTEARGLQAMQRFLKRVGIAKAEVALEEGSGLSRKNVVSPRATVQLLQFMEHHRWAEAWRASLPIGGVDGTLRRRFTHPPTQGNVRAKTGSLRYISTLSGYLTNQVGEPLVFSVLVNDYVGAPPGSSAPAEIDRVIELLAQSQVHDGTAVPDPAAPAPLKR